MNNSIKNTIKSRRIAFSIADGVNEIEVSNLKSALETAGAVVKIIAPHSGSVTTVQGTKLTVDHGVKTTSSVLFDAVLVPVSISSEVLLQITEYVLFVHEAYKHYKTIGLLGNSKCLLPASADTAGVFLSPMDDFIQQFSDGIARHRHWERSGTETIPV